MNQNLGITFRSFVKFLISLGCLVDRNLVRDNERRVRPARDNHIAQVSIVFLDIALSGPNGKTLEISL